MEKLKIAVIIAILTALLSGCTKNIAITGAVPPEYTYSVRLTDVTAASGYSKVNIDIRNVIVVGQSGRSYTLTSHPGIYNLAKFSNGRDTLIAVGMIGETDIDYIRIIMGTNHSVVKNGITYPLRAMNYQQTSIQVDANQVLQLGMDNSVVIDFDAAASIKENNNVFRLSPVTRTLISGISVSLVDMTEEP